PKQLRALIRSHQKLLYALLLRHSAGALLDVGREHKDLGAELGLLAVLQTWTRDLRFHPHVHCVVPAGGLSADGLRWLRPKNPAYFLPQAVLAMRLRTRLKQALQQDHPQLFLQIPRQVWSMDWVADVQPVGRGESALKYLAAYLYRTAFSAERMVEELRDWWRTHRNPKFLFPSPGRGWADRTFSLSQSMTHSTAPMSVSSVQMAYLLARAASAVNTASTTHSLRHSYATHLLE